MIDAAVHMRFDVPDVDAWSFGFVYHANVSGDNQDFNATYLISPPFDSGVYAEHWSIDDGEWNFNDISVIAPRLILRGTGGANALVFRTSEDGAFIRLNEETVLEVPASDLVRQSGSSEVCVGFTPNESEPYSVQYSDFRREFARKDDDGTLLHDGESAQNVACNQLVLSPRTNSAWGLFDFVAPSVANWSLAVRYHENARRGSVTRTAIGSNQNGPFYAHTHWLRGEADEDQVFGEIDAGLIRRGRNALNTVEFELRPEGFWLRLNGEKIIDLPANDLRPYGGRLEICAGQFLGETERYQIHYSNLWAWVK